jgi:hypothetical protein
LDSKRWFILRELGHQGPMMARRRSREKLEDYSKCWLLRTSSLCSIITTQQVLARLSWTLLDVVWQLRCDRGPSHCAATVGQSGNSRPRPRCLIFIKQRHTTSGLSLDHVAHIARGKLSRITSHKKCNGHSRCREAFPRQGSGRQHPGPHHLFVGATRRNSVGHRLAWLT